jgi:tripartite-type tricarboxylate transporter receptor subunit TctC
LPYDAFKDLAPVTQVAISPIVLVVPEAQPMKSVKELVSCQIQSRKISVRHFWQCHDVASLWRASEEEHRH